MTTHTYFAYWLEDQLHARGWNQAELVRRSGMSSGTISRIITGGRNPGADAIANIAQALHLPAEEVMRHAGLLPMPPEVTLDDRQMLDDLRRRIERLAPADRRYLVELMGRLFPDER